MISKKEITAEFKISEDFAFINLEGFQQKINEMGEQASATVTDFLNVILAGGLKLDSSDIHFEPTKNDVFIRLRVDGLLYEAGRLSLKIYAGLINRIKLLSELKINIYQEAQDGRFTIVRPVEAVEVRVSINPSKFGETMVLRLLDPQKIGLDISELGMRADDQEISFNELKKPNGMILVTGPTGSGKTTTLYAFLKKIQKTEIKIITIEDPIEYHLPGVEQTQVDEAANYTFENGLKSILRQDPDVLLIGEIRDQPTAEIASHASLTGHLVFSTLHTNDAIGAIPRLIGLGLKPQAIGPALNLVIAQRLVRRLCQNCRQQEPLPVDLSNRFAELLKQLPQRIDKDLYKQVRLYKPGSCEQCNFTGFKGRIGIYELFRFIRDFELLLTDDITEKKIEETALEHGFVPLQVDGILKALTGRTSLEEVERVTGPLQWTLKKG